MSCCTYRTGRRTVCALHIRSFKVPPSLEVFVVGEKFIELCVLSGFWLSINQGSIILSTFSLLKLPGVFLPHFPRKGNELGKVGNRARRKSLVWKCFGTADSFIGQQEPKFSCVKTQTATNLGFTTGPSRRGEIRGQVT